MRISHGAPQALATPPRNRRPVCVGSLVVMEPVTVTGVHVGVALGVPDGVGVAVGVGVGVPHALGTITACDRKWGSPEGASGV